MTPKKVKEAVNYWIKTAEHDYDTMRGLFRLKRYSDSLFFGHIVLEKILKAHVVRAAKKEAPYIHNLLRLQETAQLFLTEEQIHLLALVNDFNIRARYPEYKLKFYKQCTKSYTERYLAQINDLYHELCQRLRQKK